MSRDLVSAVQYLRMSTEHQKYSFENQAAVIAAYAVERGYEIVRSYEDAGRSGLHLKGRPGLQALLADSLKAERDFNAILVLDVSRWGRFQDTDQAAHYEFICREAGVHIAYCGELFENDGGMVSAIMKHLKRVMAGEYSRELSAKVTRAKRQQAALGFRQGGSIPYGFRRLLLDESGAPKFVLKSGQLKGLHGDRVRLVPGPPNEVAGIRRIFRLYIESGGCAAAVARRLNGRPGGPPGGMVWSRKRVLNLIQNELCLGVQVYGLTARTLRAKLVRQSPTSWTRARIGNPIVSRKTFAEANRLAAKGGGKLEYSDADLLRHLRRVLRREGRLSSNLLDDDARAPFATTYVLRYGSLSAAYAAVGYARPGARWIPRLSGYWTRDAILGAIRRLHAKHGYVSAKLISEDRDAPGVTTVLSRFGNLTNCYEAAGLHGNLEDACRITRAAAQARRREKYLARLRPSDRQKLEASSADVEGRPNEQRPS